MERKELTFEEMFNEIERAHEKFMIKYGKLFAACRIRHEKNGLIENEQYEMIIDAQKTLENWKEKLAQSSGSEIACSLLHEQEKNQKCFGIFLAGALSGAMYFKNLLDGLNAVTLETAEGFADIEFPRIPIWSFEQYCKGEKYDLADEIINSALNNSKTNA